MSFVSAMLCLVSVLRKDKDKKEREGWRGKIAIKKRSSV